MEILPERRGDDLNTVLIRLSTAFRSESEGLVITFAEMEEYYILNGKTGPINATFPNLVIGAKIRLVLGTRVIGTITTTEIKRRNEDGVKESVGWKFQARFKK